MSTSSRGSARERQLARLLEADGWAVTRGAGSHGEADLWAARPHFEEVEGTRVSFVRLRLIQVKTDRRGPFANFGPAKRQALSALAAQTGGTAELMHWPAHGKPRYYTESEWP